jgi:hypothetical protein
MAAGERQEYAMTDSNESTGKKIVRYEEKPVPRSIEEWIRKTKSDRNLNDLVEEIHMDLVNETHSRCEEYRGFLDATHDSQAVEGSLAADNNEAARIIREEARSSKPTGLVARSNLASIIKALNVVMSRYNMTRKERRTMIGGETVKPAHDDDNGKAA